MAGQPVDLTEFFHAVIGHLVQCPGGTTFIARLGLDPAIKMAWTELKLPKSKKMANVLDSRPDLFSRFMTDRAQPMVKLEPLGYECMHPNPIPPLDPTLAATGLVKQINSAVPTPSSGLAVGLPGPGVQLSPTDARKVFLMNALPLLASRPDGSLDLAQIGSVPEVQQAWKAGGLDKKYKMVEVLRERPDLVCIFTSERMSTCAQLTELGLQCALTGEVTDPDGSCPPPAQPKTSSWKSTTTTTKGMGKGGYGKGGCVGGTASSRYSPYPVAAALPPGPRLLAPGPMAPQLWPEAALVGRGSMVDAAALLQAEALQAQYGARDLRPVAQPLFR